MIEDTRLVTSTGSEVNANTLLTAGWTLLMVSDRQNGLEQWTHYVFGWQSPGSPPELTFSGVEPVIEI